MKLVFDKQEKMQLQALYWLTTRFSVAITAYLILDYLAGLI